MEEILLIIKERLNDKVETIVNGGTYSVVKEGDINIYRVIFYGDIIRARAVRIEENANGDQQFYYAGFHSVNEVLEVIQENQEEETINE